MSTTVTVNTYTHSVTYVSDNILKSFKDIIRLTGLDPYHLTSQWEVLLLGLSTWIKSEHLEKVILEVYNPQTDALVDRWDIEVVYTWSAGGEGNFWTDTEQLKYAIKKHGLNPSSAKYRLLVVNKSGAGAVPGWSSTDLRSTAHMVRQTLGSTIEHNGLGANTSYWRMP
jgi:hypothetical protein